MYNRWFEDIKFFERYLVYGYGCDNGCGIKISSRFMQAREIVAMLNFVFSLDSIYLGNKIKEVFWDSENGLSINIDCVDETNIREMAQIVYCAKRTMRECHIYIKSSKWEIALEQETEDLKYGHETFDIEEYLEIQYLIKRIRKYTEEKKDSSSQACCKQGIKLCPRQQICSHEAVSTRGRI